VSRVTIVVARARNGAIGRGNALPWRLPEDLKHFRATTTGHAIVMGRRTFESIGRPLPGRRSIVVTRDAGWSHPGCERAATLDEAIALASTPGADPSIASDEVFVVGGAQVYAQALAVADRVIATEIDVDVEDADAFFPALPDGQWRAVARTRHRSSTGVDFDVVDYHRRRAGET
jgi:dihydrofolate reductase